MLHMSSPTPASWERKAGPGFWWSQHPVTQQKYGLFCSQPANAMCMCAHSQQVLLLACSPYPRTLMMLSSRLRNSTCSREQGSALKQDHTSCPRWPAGACAQNLTWLPLTCFPSPPCPFSLPFIFFLLVSISNVIQPLPKVTYNSIEMAVVSKPSVTGPLASAQGGKAYTRALTYRVCVRAWDER